MTHTHECVTHHALSKGESRVRGGYPGCKCLNMKRVRQKVTQCSAACPFILNAAQRPSEGLRNLLIVVFLKRKKPLFSLRDFLFITGVRKLRRVQSGEDTGEKVLRGFHFRPAELHMLGDCSRLLHGTTQAPPHKPEHI